MPLQYTDCMSYCTVCSANSKDTWKNLNCLVRCKKTSKDVTLNHNGSSISEPSAVAEVFNNYSSNIASNLDHDIPHSNISPLYFLGAPVENSFFCPPPLTVKQLLIQFVGRRTNPQTS